MSKRIAFFNHKGGVSKTTSVYNLGWVMARNHRVLIVDGDPQCNLTSLVLGDRFEEYYLEPATMSQNIKDGVKVAFEGKPAPIQAVDCASPERAPNLYLLAGHANLSEYDAALTFAHTSSGAIATLQNLPGAIQELVRLTEDKYSIEYTLIDMNPSLSSINQNLFIVSSAFVLPTNPDPFSVMALKTLERVLPQWAKWVESIAPVFAEAAYPLPTHTPKFLGTLIQRFNIRRGRAARSYQDYIDEIKETTRTSFSEKLEAASMTFSTDNYAEAGVDSGFCLGEISDFQSLLPKSYVARVPVFELTDDEINETGPVLEQLKEKRVVFNDLFVGLAAKIVTLSDYA